MAGMLQMLFSGVRADLYIVQDMRMVLPYRTLDQMYQYIKKAYRPEECKHKKWSSEEVDTLCRFGSPESIPH